MISSRPSSPDLTVADWIAEGESTIALSCARCSWGGIVDLADLPPTMTRSRLARNARCRSCGGRGAQVRRDMHAHCARLEAKGGFSASYPDRPAGTGNEKPRRG